jgi:predicted nucleic acid-binding protein
LQEIANILHKKFQFDWTNIQTVLKEAALNNSLHTNGTSTIADACRVAKRYGFSFYDSLIVAPALENACGRLFSEDLQNGQIIDDVLIIENPF